MDAAERSSTDLTGAEVALARSRHETPVYFESDDAMLFGVLTRPTGIPLNAGFISVAGGTRGTSMGRNRMMVRLSRTAAARGFHAFRFDYHGVGESGGGFEGFSLKSPFGRDLVAAARWMEEHGIDRSVYAGDCFGGQTILSSLTSLPEILGVSLVEMIIRGDRRTGGGELARYSIGQLLRIAIKPWVIAGLFKKEQRAYYAKFLKAKIGSVWLRLRSRSRPDEDEATDLVWVSTDFLDKLRMLVDRGIPVQLIYGEGSDNYREFGLARSGELGELLEAAGPMIQVVALPGRIHGYSDLLSQQRVIDAIEGWAAGLFESRGPESVRGDGAHA